MKKTTIFGAAGFCLVAAFSVTQPRAEADPSAAWNRKAAAAYLDQRASWWTTWPNAQRDHGTFCVSCHTVRRCLARPSFAGRSVRPASVPEAALFVNVTKRVTMGATSNRSTPIRPAAHPRRANRVTEAILNAGSSRGVTRPPIDERRGRRALDNMWRCR